MTTSKNNLLQWELDWVDSNKKYYKDTQHLEQVKRNIYTRYKLNVMLHKLEQAL